MTRRRIHTEPRRYWTAEEDAQLRALFPDMLTAELARLLRRSLSSTHQRAHTLGVRKSAPFLARLAAESRLRDAGAPFRFKKGQTPPNKGLRRPGWGPGRMKATQFTKGQPGWNWKPIGATRLIAGYQYTKIANRRKVPWTRNWKPTHVLLWEKQHGRIRRGRALVFKNGDRTDIRLDNLELISRGDLMRRNTLHNLPEPLPHMYQLIGAINRKINRRSREEQNRRPA